MRDKIITLLHKITDEKLLASVYWFINKALVR